MKRDAKIEGGDNVVEFVCHPNREGEIPEPQPASDVLPWWYENLPLKAEKDDSPFGLRTVRLCPAFLDALSLGWVVPYDDDLVVDTTGDEISFGKEGASAVSETTLGSGDLPDRAVGSIEIQSDWAVSLPDDYSLLVVPPMNRLEPRYDVVGKFIDVGETITPLDLDLLWCADESKTIIRKGDPLVQVFPMKRDSLLLNGIIRPFNREGKVQYDRVKNRTSTDDSWYRINEWEPKATRMVNTS